MNPFVTDDAAVKLKKVAVVNPANFLCPPLIEGNACGFSLGPDLPFLSMKHLR